MPRAKKKTTTTKYSAKRKVRRRPTDRRKNIVGNFKGEENIFWNKVIAGFKKLLSPAFKK